MQGKGELLGWRRGAWSLLASVHTHYSSTAQPHSTSISIRLMRSLFGLSESRIPLRKEGERTRGEEHRKGHQINTKFLPRVLSSSPQHPTQPSKCTVYCRCSTNVTECWMHPMSHSFIKGWQLSYAVVLNLINISQCHTCKILASLELNL